MPSTSPPAGPIDGRADQDAAVGVRDELDQALAPCGSSRGSTLDMSVDADPHVAAGVAGLRLGHPDRADLRVGERHPRHGAVVGGRPVLAEDVADHDRGLVHRHVRERALAGDVADGPQPVGRRASARPRRRRARGRVETDRVQADVAEVRAPPGRDEQPLGASASPSATSRVNRPVVTRPSRCRRRRAPRCPLARTPRRAARGLGLLQRQQPVGRLDDASPGPRTGRMTCASSTPMAPPPMTTREPGASVASIASRLVQYGVPASPSIGGTAGSVPVLSRLPFSPGTRTRRPRRCAGRPAARARART